MLKIMKKMVKNEEGQGMAEYGLILAGIAVLVIAGIAVLGPKIAAMFVTISGSL